MVDTRAEYDELYAIYWPIAVVVLVVVVGAILFAAVRWRSREQAMAKGRDDAPVGEPVYAIGLALIVGFLVYVTFQSMSQLRSDDPTEASAAAPPGGPPLTLKVTASRWNWRFEYPAYGVSEAGAPGRLPELVVPVGNVRFELTSIDVIHSWFVASLRFKRDAFPGRVNAFTLGFKQPGLERGGGQCAEFCGLRHSYMDFDVRVLPRPEFERWARAQARVPEGTS